jgi:hypothetical protein
MTKIKNEIQVAIDLFQSSSGDISSVSTSHHGTASFLPYSLVIKLSAGEILAVPRNSSDSQIWKANEIEILHPKWKKSLDVLVDQLKRDLNCSQFNVGVRLDQLVAIGSDEYEYKVDDTSGNVFAVLFVHLPSVFSGGDLLIGDSQEKCKFGSVFDCEFACFLVDVKHKFLKVESGSRVFLAYHLLWNENVKAPSAKACLRSQALGHMKSALANWNLNE